VVEIQEQNQAVPVPVEPVTPLQPVQTTFVPEAPPVQRPPAPPAMDFVQESGSNEMLEQPRYTQTPDLTGMPQPPQPGLAQLAQTQPGHQERGEDNTWFEQTRGQAPPESLQVPPDPLAPQIPVQPQAPQAPQAPVQPVDQTQAMPAVQPPAPQAPEQGIPPLPPAHPQILDEDD